MGNALAGTESRERKTELDRMAAMLSRLGGRGYNVREESGSYSAGEIGPYFDNDFEKNRQRKPASGCTTDPAGRGG